MATNYTTLLGLALPTQGELSGTWGDTVNNYITNYLDAAVAGTQTLSTDADVTLTKTTGGSLGGTSSQYAIINCTGSRAAQRTITAPAASKMYTIINATTGGFAVKLVGAGPTTGVTIPNGMRAFVVWNGSDFNIVSMANASGVSIATYGGTGQSSYAVGDLLYADTTTSLAKLADVATGNALISGGVGVAPSWGKVGLTTHVSGTLAVGNGGTGVATLTGVAYGNGTSAFSAATGAQISSALGATAVQNATTAAATTASVTFNNGGAGAASGTTFNGGTAQTISYNTVGASPLAGSGSLTTTGTVTSGTWSASFGAVSGANLTNITGANVTGTVGSATNATNVAIAADTTTAATFYVPYASATTGNVALKGTRLTVNPSTGDFAAAGNVTAYSDERLKTNWRGFDSDVLEQLSKVKSGVYDRTDTSATQVGVSAQSLQAVLPDAVNTGEDGMLSVAYGNAALAMCVELAKEIVALKARIAQLEA